MIVTEMNFITKALVELPKYLVRSIICIGEFYSNISDVNGVSQLLLSMQQETFVQPFISHSRSQLCKQTPKSRETSLRCA